MTGLNHSLTGAVIGGLLPLPVAVPVAFASHFVLDSLPHFGEVFEKRKRLSKTVWAIDICASICFLTLLLVSHQWVMFVCAVTAMSPDFAWVYRFTLQEKFGKLAPKPENRFNTWHVRIQRYESRKGLAVDVIWAVAMSALLWKWW